MQKLTQEIGRDRTTPEPSKDIAKLEPLMKEPAPIPSGSTGQSSQNAKEINQRGIDLIKRAEGLKTNAYQDAGGKWTIGYGHTGTDVGSGKVISEGEAESLLKNDIDWAEKVVQQSVKVPLNSNQFSAVTSLVYNIGSGNFAKSPVLQNLNAGKYQEAADAFAHHNRGSGKVLQSLINRRAAEKELFLKPDAAPAELPKEINKSSSDSPKQGIPASSNLTDKLLETARSYIGVREQGGNNRGPQVEEFQRAVDGKAVGEPWCMSFVQHCIKSTEAASKVDSKVFSSEHCLTTWNKSPGELKLSKPERGSLAIWQYGNSSNGHVGIVDQVNADGTFTTIEGNTSGAVGDREGDGVFSKTHSTKNSGDRRLVGFLKVF
jgi:lysozyme